MSNDTKDINKLMKQEEVSAELMKQCLNTGIYDVSKTHIFLSGVLQCITIYYSHMLPTAGVLFNADAKKWDMAINPFFFCKKLSQPQRKAVLIHEILHLLHKHPFRIPFLKISNNKRALLNIGADMSINFYIKDLPNGCPQCPPKEEQMNGAQCPNEMCPGACIDVKDYYDEDETTKKKTPWPTGKTMEFYYEKLLEKFKDISPDDSGEGECGTCKGSGKVEDGQGGERQCPDCKGSGKGKGKSLPREFDSHKWDGNAEETEMLDATEELMKRAMVKQSLSYDQLPGSIQELLDDIKARKAELNYKAIILSAIKRHASGHDRKNTWARKSRRFGELAPGSTVSDLPKLSVFADSSGSISVEELTEFLDIIDEFLKCGSRKCEMNMFHTSNYLSQPYKRGDRFDRKKVQSGGTDLTDSLKHIVTTRPDLAIIITDGYFGDVDFEKMLRPNQHMPQIVWIISRQGQKDHPLKRCGYTVKVPETTKLKSDKELENK